MKCTKKPTDRRGWIIPYLIEGDSIFGYGRLAWWLNVTNKLPKEPIPRIAWREVSNNDIRPELKVFPNGPLSAAGVLKHVKDLLDRLHGGWESLIYFLCWLSWGLHVERLDRRLHR